MVTFQASIKQIASKQLVSGDRGVRLTIDINVPQAQVMEGLNQVWASQKNESGELQFTIND